jgi:hypothetical protein
MLLLIAGLPAVMRLEAERIADLFARFAVPLSSAVPSLHSGFRQQAQTLAFFGSGLCTVHHRRAELRSILAIISVLLTLSPCCLRAEC